MTDMGTNDIAAVMRRFDEAMGMKDAAAAAGLSTEDVEYSDHRALGWETIHGRAALEVWYQSMFDSLQGLHVRSEVIERSGDTALLHQEASFRAPDQDGGGDGAVSLTVRVTLRDGQLAKVEILE